MIVIKKRIIFALVLCIAGTIYAVTQVKPHKVFKSGSRSIPIYSVDRDEDIALTFNCAWGDEDIDDILKTLDKYKVKATFFVVGTWAEKYPDALGKLRDKGHEIGGHSYNHKDYTTLTANQIKEDTDKNKEAISKVTGADMKLFRVPSGAYNNLCVDTIEELGYIPIQWSVDSIDYGDAGVDDIYSRATTKTKSGDIILMHTGTKNTALALPRILDSLCAKFKLVKISELIYEKDFIVNNDGKMIQNN